MLSHGIAPLFNTPLRTGLFWLENMVSLQYTNSFRTNLTLDALQ